MQGPELTTPRPATREAVLALVSGRVGQWRLDEIEEHLLRSGWLPRDHLFPQREGINLAVSRLLGSGELERVRPGVVRYATSAGRSPANVRS